CAVHDADFDDPDSPGIWDIPPPAATVEPDEVCSVPGPAVVAAAVLPGPADDVVCSLPDDVCPGPASFDVTSEPVLARIATVATTATSTSANPAAISRLSATQ